MYCMKSTLLYIYIILIFLFVRCAQITPLTGGTKDANPPKVVKMVPENASLNFSAGLIEIQFDEYIVLKNVANQLIITPQTKELPDVEAVGKKVRIKFNETLLPNTTYKLAFGNAITDLRESNVLQNFEYIFSTGNSMDSLSMKGAIIRALDKKPVAGLLVGLYPADAADSIIYKDKPLYTSRTDNNGSYRFSYLPGKDFKIAAIQDQNKNLMYDGSEEELAFLNHTVRPGDSLVPAMYLFKEIPVKSFVKKTTSAEYGKALVIYNKPQPVIKGVRATGVIAWSNSFLRDTVFVYYTNKFDTLNALIDFDGGRTDTVLVKIPSDNTVERMKKNYLFNYSFQTNFGSTLMYSAVPEFSLNVPAVINDIDHKKIKLTEVKDTARRQIDFTFVPNNASVVSSFKLKADIKPDQNYEIQLDSAIFKAADGRFNSKAVYKFKTTTEEDYAILNLKLFFPKKENYLVLLLDEKEQLVRESKLELSLASTSEKIITYNDLLPGNYFVRIIEDANKNGLFDTGNYFSHQQAEVIYVNPSPIKLLSGWEVESEWIVK